MGAGKNWRLRCLLSAIAMLGAAIGWSSPSHAYVQQFVIDSTNTANYSPIPLGSSTPGAPVSYTIYTGRIFGALSPTNPLNAVITDINRASPVYTTPTPPAGDATYISQFSIVTPTDPAARNGLMIYEVPNRGGSAISTGSLIAGATYVQSGWQGDLLSQCSGAPGVLPVSPYPCVNLNSGPYGTASGSYPFYTAPAGLTPFVIQVPVATTDGNPPNGTNTITGQVYSHIKATPPLAAGTTTAQLVIYSSFFTPFQPVSLDTNQAQFWYDTAQSTDGVDTGKTTIPSSQWSWAYCPSGPPGTPNPDWICLNSGTFNTNYLYEMVYTAANPLVQGVGFAAARDFASFVRYGTTAPSGGSNPIAGTVTRAMIVGVSQSGAFDRSLVFNGFNEDEDGRIVFDGDWVIISGRILYMNERWSQPNVLSNLYMGGNEAPVWWADYPNQSRGLPAAGMLDRCTTTGTCPQVMETWGGNEFYINKMGADLVGFCSTCSEIPQPSNVYRYYVAGATHGGGAVSFNWVSPASIAVPFSSSAMYPTSPIPETYTNNALQYAFIELLMNGTPMPPSGSGISYPSLNAGQLAPATNQAAVGFPNIPGITYGANQAWPSFVYNFGPGVDYTQQSGVPTIEPPTIANIVSGQCPSGICTPYVPTVNADGNEFNDGSIPTVLSGAPLATYLSWNIIPSGPYAGQAVELNAGYWPFWDTAAHRVAASDPRPSLEERYGTHAGYNCVVRVAANKAVGQRFLLSSDLTTLVTLANAGNVLTTGFTPTTADTALANDVLCGLTATHDFNGDGKSDILWRDTGGDIAVWLMNGGTVTQSTGLSTVPGTLSVVGQKDFNGDGNADILWRDTSGNVSMWFMNGAAVASTAAVGNLASNWGIYGTADLNGDGKGDLLLRDSGTGTVSLWLMNGATIASTKNLGAVPATWTIVGEANGDILWRDAAGDIALWIVQNGQVTGSAGLGTVPSNFVIQGVGDFNGDGSIDILWRDTTSGTLSIWFTNGTQVTSGASVGTLPSTWNVAAVGDYNGDGYSDILLLDSAGDLAEWLMTGATVSSSVGVGNVGTTWTVQNVNAN